MAERLQSLIQIHLATLRVVSIPGPGSDFYERKTPNWLSDDRCFCLFLTNTGVSRVIVHVKQSRESQKIEILLV